MEAQFAKMDVPLTSSFSHSDELSAIEKVTYAAKKYEPSNPGVGFSAFSSRTMKPFIFREMVKRTFFVQFTDRELAAMVQMFDREKKNEVVCVEFIKKFNQLANNVKTNMRVSQFEKTKEIAEKKVNTIIRTEKLKHEKLLGFVDFNYEKTDFDSAVSKIAQIAVNYNPTHVSAPSLKGEEMHFFSEKKLMNI